MWRREIRIPMGGPFSTECADLHTLWKVKWAGKRLRDWGAMHKSESGHRYWCRGTASLVFASLETTYYWTPTFPLPPRLLWSIWRVV